MPEHDLNNAYVLVTGGLGLMGRPLIDLLLAEGAVLRVADIVSKPNDLDPRIDYWHVDLEDRDAVIGMLKGVDYVFHLAGAKGGAGIGRNRAADFLRANLQSTLYLFKELRKSVHKTRRVLLVSSVGAYSGDKSFFKESEAWEGEPHPSDYYGGWAKRFGELMCRAYREQFGLDYVIVRPTSTFGPHDRFDIETGMVVAALIARLEAGEKPLVLHGNPAAMRDFLYSEDAAAGMLLAMKRGLPGGTYNLGTGKPKTIPHVAWALARLYGTEVTVEPSEDKSPWLRCMDMKKSEAELGFKAEWSLERALEATVEWYRANKGQVKYDPFK